MLTITLNLDSLAFYIVVADILILLGYILYIKHRGRQLQRSIDIISQFITDYFRNSGSEVQVSCIRHTDRRFIVMVESEPLKRFRYSNILESNLINHIYKHMGNMVEKIYWRFPVQLSKEAILGDEGADLVEDDYLIAGQAQIKQQMDYGVSEVSWEEFEKAKQGK